MGGYVTLAFYRKFPQRTAGIILAATRAGADSLEGKSNRDKAIELVRQSGSEAIAQSMLPKMVSAKTYADKPDLVERVYSMMRSTSESTIVGDLSGMRDRSDSTGLLSQIIVPTLVIHGEDDQLIPLAEMLAMHAAIQGSIAHLIPKAGHLVNLEQPERFNQAVIDFIHNLTW
jgi:pimeloyl-ACP methyl ester carboxylesterase